MRIGIIDFGTNTLRLDIFETEEGAYRSIYDNAIFSRIIENTEGASLSQDGIEHVIQAIEEHQSACRHYRCDRVECFATASLRYIDNADSVLEQVEFRTGVKIKMISGNEEAEYDFRALKSVSKAQSGVGCDLGGGSMQLFVFDEKGPAKSASFPLGSSRIAKQFVSGAIPTASEIENIKNEVKKQLSAAGFSPANGSLSAMGGTAKAVKRLFGSVLKIEGAISVSELSGFLKAAAEAPEETLELLEDVEPKRARTLVPGAAVLAGIMEFMGFGKMEVYSVGVREGFLEKILEEGEGGGEPGLLDIILGSIGK